MPIENLYFCFKSIKNHKIGDVHKKFKDPMLASQDIKMSVSILLFWLKYLLKWFLVLVIGEKTKVKRKQKRTKRIMSAIFKKYE